MCFGLIPNSKYPAAESSKCKVISDKWYDGSGEQLSWINIGLCDFKNNNLFAVSWKALLFILNSIDFTFSFGIYILSYILFELLISDNTLFGVILFPFWSYWKIAYSAGDPFTVKR